MVLGLERRLPQLARDITALERENDQEMYGAISMQLIERELSEIQQLMDKLNSSALRYQQQSTSAVQQVRRAGMFFCRVAKELRVTGRVLQLAGVASEMERLENYDSMQVVKRQQANRRLTRDLQECKNGHQHMVQPTRRPPGTSQRHRNVPENHHHC